jgi:Arc/MetJ family transcription regulator
MTQTSERRTTRTNIVLDTQLVETAMKMTGLRTRRELVDYALRELVRHQQQMKLLELKGRVDWEGDLEAMRTGAPGEDWD